MNGDYQPFSDTLEWVRKAGHVCDYSVKGFAVDSDRWHHQTRPNCIFPHEMWVQGHFGHFNVKSSIFMRSNFRGWNMNFCQIMICWYVNSLAYFMPKNSRKLNHHENKWFHIINISPRFVNDFCIMCKNNLKQIIYLGIYNLAILHFSPLVNNVWTFLFLFIYFFFFSVFSSSFFFKPNHQKPSAAWREARQLGFLRRLFLVIPRSEWNSITLRLFNYPARKSYLEM